MIKTRLFFNHDGTPQSKKTFEGDAIFSVELDYDFEIRVGDNMTAYPYFRDMWDDGKLFQRLNLLLDEKDKLYVYLEDYLYDNDFEVDRVLYSINGKKEITREVYLMPE